MRISSTRRPANCSATPPCRNWPRPREKASEIQYRVLSQGIQALSDESGAIDGFPGFSYEAQVVSTGLEDMREVVLRIIWDRRNPAACEVVFFVRGATV